ncbi:MAG: DUF1559 domain-containing protein [Planctomycetaceae bacterium]|nr:DUF1559 domain-containing protein [Planctomycetaceae bacterium]
MTKQSQHKKNVAFTRLPSGDLRPPLARRYGFTLVELLVVSAIISILVALLLPAVQQSREAARRTQCKNNIRQLALALQTYHDQFEMFPAGTVNADGPIRNETSGYHHNWVIALLPHLGENPLFESIDPKVSVYDLANREARRTRLSLLLCPSDPARDHASVTGERLEPLLTNYAGCHHSVEAPIDVDNNGVLYLNSFLRISAIEDGTSKTIAIGEIKRAMDDLGWASGTRATLRNCGLSINDTPGGMAYYLQDSPPQAQQTGPTHTSFQNQQQLLPPERQNEFVGGFGSHHTGGMHSALADGSVRFLSENINPTVYERLGDRADHELLEPF